MPTWGPHWLAAAERPARLRDVPFADLPADLRLLLVSEGTLAYALEAYQLGPIVADAEGHEQMLLDADHARWLRARPNDLALSRRTALREQATGRLIVHRDVATEMLGALRRLYTEGFPIRRMTPVDAYGGSDFRSIEADNTSAFNCRYVDGTTRWSEHAYGRAIDVNPIENPYVGSSGTSSHAASGPYVRRTPFRPGMAAEGHALVRAFDVAGWGWGGRWSATPATTGSTCQRTAPA